MSSFSLISSYILCLNVLLVLAQQQPQQTVNLAQQQHQQTLTVHQPPSSGQTQHHQQQQQLVSNSNNEEIRIKNTESGVSGNKNQNQNQQTAMPVVGLFSSSYRNPPSNVREQLPGQYVSTQQGYTTYSGYPQEVQTYATTVQQPPQLFGLSSTGDFQLSAYFGPVFWITVSLIIIILLIIITYRSAGGFERLGGFVDDLQKTKKDGTGRAIDLDKLTAMAYTAFDQYGKWKNPSYKKS